MINNLPTNPDSYFYYTQVSLEGMLKFLGQWSHDHFDALQLIQQQQQVNAQKQRKNFTESITNLVSGGSNAAAVASTSGANLLDEVSNKIIQVAEFLAEERPSSPTTPLDSTSSSSNWPMNELTPTTTNTSSMSIVQRAFYRNNLDIASVLRTVLDYYESFFKNPCLQLKLDIIRSMLYLANSLYDSRQQFEALGSKLQLNCDWLNAFIQQDIDNLGVRLN